MNDWRVADDGSRRVRPCCRVPDADSPHRATDVHGYSNLLRAYQGTSQPGISLYKLVMWVCPVHLKHGGSEPYYAIRNDEKIILILSF